MMHAIRGAQRFAAAPVWLGYILELYTDISDLEESIRDQARPAGHSVGTASMSPAQCALGSRRSGLKAQADEGSEGCGRVGFGEVSCFVRPISGC